MGTQEFTPSFVSESPSPHFLAPVFLIGNLAKLYLSLEELTVKLDDSEYGTVPEKPLVTYDIKEAEFTKL